MDRLRVFWAPVSMVQQGALEGWLNDCLHQCQGSGPGWEHKVELTILRETGLNWLAVFSITIRSSNG